MLWVASLNQPSWYANPAWWAVITSFLLGIAAIFGRNIRNWLFRPKFEYFLKETEQKINNETRTMVRVSVRNTGKRAAASVTAMVTQIVDKRSSKWTKRKDFIHMPLRWTHLNFEPRTIAANQEVYLDIGNHYIFDEVSGFKLSTYITDEEKLYVISNNALITVRLSEQQGFSSEFELILNWNKIGEPKFTLSFTIS